MPVIGKLLGMPEGRRTYEENRVLAMQRCNTGLEFEAENVRNRLPPDQDEAGYWTEKEDGSLRGASMEYVLREPLFGNDLVEAVNFLCNWGSKENLECNFRTGLHVHIDVRNLQTDELISMFIYYSLFEKVLFNWVGDEREGSIFCMPFYKAEGVLEQVVKAFRAETKMKDAAKSIDRYAAFNLNSLSRFGTVEFRHMRTTFNQERVIKWINICQSLKKYAKHNPLKPHELLAEMSKMGPANIFAAIFGPALAGELWSKESEKHVYETGIPVAQEIAILLDGSEGLAWDSVRSALGTGSNPRWAKWTTKQKANSELNKVPENPFSDPELLKDPEIQKEAIGMLSALIRAELDKPIK